jgi:7-cyano-7-deazaguanine synthase in queuosine biosynthesis
MPERLVVCGGARHAGGDSILRLALSGRSQNVSLKLEDISKKLVRNIPGLLVDLIEIASYVFCADQATSRGGEAQQAMGADWRRDFRFVIPVRNPGHWNRRNVLEALCSTLSFLSDDNYTFHFEKATNPAPIQNYLEFGGESGTGFKADEVVLFSGGLDSLGGAVEELSNGSRVALVSHRSSSKIFDHQKHLVAELRRRFPNQVLHVPVLMTRQEPLRVEEHTQRTRSFLYAALAGVIAQLFENTRIRFFENGIVSINLPISEQVVGARATRTTHPMVLELLRQFFSATTGTSIEVDNPFIWKTRTDVTASIVNRGCGELIKHTVSCTRTYEMTKLYTHCGCCSQCLDRRFAVLAANAAEHDPVEMYRVELLAGARERPNDQTMAESYVRTALELREMSELAFFGRFSGETARVRDGFPSLTADEVGRQVLNLHQRHAQAIGEVLRAGVEAHSAELVNRSLSPSSVLRMTVAPGGAPVLATIGKRDDAIKMWIDKAEVESASADQRAGDQAAAQAHEPSQTARRKSKPALERARGAIKELYPSGVPGQAVEPNPDLCRRVGEKLKQSGLRNVSDDTILRAAGRRK